MNKEIGWGILGPGAVARRFAGDLRHVDGARLVAVASRSRERAAAFAADFGASRSHAGHDALIADVDVDAVYVATPHVFHRDHAVACLRGGKHVLCEKPLALNAREAEEMIEAARKAGRLLMEAMWTRFLPAMARTRELIASGTIGEVRRVTADFGFRARFDPGDRLFDLRLGGGALLDVGVYPVSLAHMILGPPAAILGAARIGETGVDEEAAVLLGYEGGRHAVLGMAITLETACDARIDGTEGWIRLPERWWAPRSITLGGGGRPDRSLDLPFRGSGFVDEIEAFTYLARRGAPESPVMPLGESLSVMRTMDRIRERWALRYPSERRGGA